MRAVAFQSPVVSQPPDAVDQLLYSDRLLTAKEVARVLAISEKTVYSYVSKGLIPTTRFSPPSGFAPAMSACG